MLGSLVERIVDQVASLIAQQVGLTWNLEAELAQLKDSLTMIQALLQDAEKKQVTDKAVKLWLGKLKNVANNADDVLDELDYEYTRQRVEQKVCRVLSISDNAIAFRFKLGSEIKKINKSLKKIMNQASGFGISVGSVSSSSVVTMVDRDNRDSFLGDTKVVGRETDVSKIIDLLVSSVNHQALTVVSIFGMAGLGKTTLAKSVCKGVEERSLFDVTMWVCVSDDFDYVAILKGMLEILNLNAGGISTGDAMLKHISGVS